MLNVISVMLRQVNTRKQTKPNSTIKIYAADICYQTDVVLWTWLSLLVKDAMPMDKSDNSVVDRTSVTFVTCHHIIRDKCNCLKSSFLHICNIHILLFHFTLVWNLQFIKSRSYQSQMLKRDTVAISRKRLKGKGS